MTPSRRGERGRGRRVRIGRPPAAGRRPRACRYPRRLYLQRSLAPEQRFLTFLQCSRNGNVQVVFFFFKFFVLFNFSSSPFIFFARRGFSFFETRVRFSVILNIFLIFQDLRSMIQVVEIGDRFQVIVPSSMKNESLSYIPTRAFNRCDRRRYAQPGTDRVSTGRTSSGDD